MPVSAMFSDENTMTMVLKHLYYIVFFPINITGFVYSNRNSNIYIYIYTYKKYSYYNIRWMGAILICSNCWSRHKVMSTSIRKYTNLFIRNTATNKMVLWLTSTWAFRRFTIGLNWHKKGICFLKVYLLDMF